MFAAAAPTARAIEGQTAQQHGADGRRQVRTPRVEVGLPRQGLEPAQREAHVRDLLGPTDSKTAPKGTIRGDFAEDKMTNVVHASDSAENAALELERFFHHGELFSY